MTRYLSLFCIQLSFLLLVTLSISCNRHSNRSSASNGEARKGLIENLPLNQESTAPLNKPTVEDTPNQQDETSRTTAASTSNPSSSALNKLNGADDKDKKASKETDLLRKAKSGDQDAMWQLGDFYSGLGNPGATTSANMNDLQAIIWYQRSEQQGNAEGSQRLGEMYANGRGVEQDDSQAVRLFRFAADQGNPRGQVSLGYMYANARGVKKDDVAAVRLYRLAADQGYAIGQSRLGFMHLNGRGVERDNKEAVRLFGLAAEQGLFGGN